MVFEKPQKNNSLADSEHRVDHRKLQPKILLKN